MTAPVNFEDVEQLKLDYLQRRNNILANKQSRGYNLNKKTFNEDLEKQKDEFIAGIVPLSIFGVAAMAGMWAMLKDRPFDPVVFMKTLKDKDGRYLIMTYLVNFGLFALVYWGLAISSYGHSQFEDIMKI